jgi:lipopolysaccharide export system ATP-binding protein
LSITISTHNLVKKYGSRTVVNHVSFNVKQGEIVGLLGPNGAGKTTSFYQVVGLVRPDEGAVFLNEEDITRLPMYKRAKMGIGYLPQEASVFRKLSVEDNLLAVLEMTPLNKQQRKEKVETLLTEFRLHHVRKSNGDVISGGERRRTEIARALAVDPKFILLDEPFAGIDPIAVEDIQAIVARLKYKNIGILITDHNVTETLSICDRAYLLIEGKIFKHGTAEELATDEQVKKLYLGRNFELKRKDWLLDEQRGISRLAEQKEVKPEMLAYSVESAIEMISRMLNKPIRVSDMRNLQELGLPDLSGFIAELKKSVVEYGALHGSERFNTIAATIPAINPNDYKPAGWLNTIGTTIGSGVTDVAYLSLLSKLENDLQGLKGVLNRILMLVKNPAFEEAFTDD